MSGTDEKDMATGTEGEAAADAKPGAEAPGGNGSGGNGTQAPPEGTGAEFPAPAPSEVDVLRAELDQVKAQLAERADAHLRLQAEFENFKKRMFKEQAEQLKYAQLPLLKELTQAMDNLERALAHIRTQGSAEAKGLASGIEMVVKQLGDTFERFGMVRVKTQDAAFDPTLHQAVSVVETDRVPENRVLQEFQAGYVLHDRVVRPAMVSVAKKTGGEPAAAKGKPASQNGEANG